MAGLRVDSIKRYEMLRRQESVHRTDDGDAGALDAEGKAAAPVDEIADRKKFYNRQVVAEEATPVEDLDKFQRFEKWLLDNGARFPKLYMRFYSPEVRGVHANEDIPSNEQIVTLPLKVLITEALGQQTEIGRIVHESGVHLTVPNHCQVIIYMLTTRAEGNSFFQPYYDILPENFDNFPIFWEDDLLNRLQGSALVQQIQERKANIRGDYDKICKVVPAFKRFSFKEFMWCRTAVGSRNFGIVVNGVKRTAMVPYADMLNHYRPRETSWTFDNSQQAFTMTSLRDLGMGQQVMDSYGKKCNSKFLMHYGFTIENNREADGRCQNELQMGFRLPEDDLREQRLRVAPLNKTLRVTMNYDDGATQEALSYVRVVAADAEELSALAASGRSPYSLGSTPIRPISAANELRALAYWAEICRVQLSGYLRPWEEDLKDLAEDKMAPFSNE